MRYFFGGKMFLHASYMKYQMDRKHLICMKYCENFKILFNFRMKTVP